MPKLPGLVAAALATVLGLVVASAAKAESEFGDNTVVSSRGVVDNQVALSIGKSATATNSVAGVQARDALRTGPNGRITTDAKAGQQTSLAVGNAATAQNGAGSVQMGDIVGSRGVGSHIVGSR